MKESKLNLTAYEKLRTHLEKKPYVWLVTGVAGFIGSNLLEALLKLDQRVVGLDNFATGYQRNLDEVKGLVSGSQWSNFEFIEGDIRSLDICRRACEGVDYVLHQAALGSVPRSLADPIATNETNVSGFLNMLVAARDAKVLSFTYAASSSTYGDHPALPKMEDVIGKPLSPYAVTKFVNEIYADVFSRSYGFQCIGLRYFNVFGRRQNPNGAYAAVIPKWIESLIEGKQIFINGDGSTSRDFCYVENVIQANLLAASIKEADALNTVYNIALGDRTSLLELYEGIKSILSSIHSVDVKAAPEFLDFRAADVKHSQADISKAKSKLGYDPKFRIGDGLKIAIEWYVGKNKAIS